MNDHPHPTDGSEATPDSPVPDPSPVGPRPPARDRSARWDRILGLLARERRLGVAEAAAELGISESTVRRDFVAMERAQLARRTHGGIVAVDVAYSLTAAPRATDRGGEQRERIAAAAAAMVRPGQIVGFNGGRTTSSTARRIVSRPDLELREGTPGLTVVCAALNIAIESVLRPAVRTVVLGGVAEPHSFELTGPLATATMRDLWLDVMFVGMIGLDVEAGLTCHSDAEAGVTRTMIAHSRRVVGLATAEKLEVRALAGICPLATLTDLVVAGEVTEPIRAHLAEHEVRLTEV